MEDDHPCFPRSVLWQTASLGDYLRETDLKFLPGPLQQCRDPHGTKPIDTH